MDEYLSGLGLRMGALAVVVSGLDVQERRWRQPSLLLVVRTNSAGKVTSNRVFHFEALAGLFVASHSL
jgi:hypothetical protein